jgi:antitoxin VapB
MGIFIKNAEAERKARELARLTGKALTAAIEETVDQALQVGCARPQGRPTVEEMKAATDRFRKAVGLDKVKLNVTPRTSPPFGKLQA